MGNCISSSHTYKASFAHLFISKLYFVYGIRVYIHIMRAFVANISDYEKEKVQNKRQKISLKYVNISCDEQKMIENEKKEAKEMNALTTKTYITCMHNIKRNKKERSESQEKVTQKQ